jgi:hypothetical protein
MRTPFLAPLAIALALPAVAVADRGHSGPSTPSATKVAKTLKAKHRRAKRTIRVRIARPRVVAVDDEREVTGRIASLAPLTVGALTCVVPAGVSLTGFVVGDVVELTCDRVGGQFVLRKIQLEEDERRRATPTTASRNTEAEAPAPRTVTTRATTALQRPSRPSRPLRRPRSPRRAARPGQAACRADRRAGRVPATALMTSPGARRGEAPP